MPDGVILRHELAGEWCIGGERHWGGPVKLLVAESSMAVAAATPLPQQFRQPATASSYFSTATNRAPVNLPSALVSGA
jgi:isoleucyl-tRNA synthetase